jgi:hypothetical protein
MVPERSVTVAQCCLRASRFSLFNVATKKQLGASLRLLSRFMFFIGCEA